MDSFDTVTRQGGSIASLFRIELVISGILLLIVVAWLSLALSRFRAAPDDPREPPQINGNRRLELVWTITPAAILAVVFGLVLITMRAVTTPESNAVSLRIIGHQWWWEYQFADQGVITANELHLPVGRGVQATLESEDVIHDFHVPRFGWMRDAVPGKTNQMSIFVEQAGQYDGACNQYCGLQHAWMRVVSIAEPMDQFETWVQQQSQPVTPNGSRGEQVFLQNTCINCHSIRGLSSGPRVGPDLTHLGSRATLGTGVVANSPQLLQQWIRDASSIKPGVLMPAFQNISDSDLAALADYLDSLK